MHERAKVKALTSHGDKLMNAAKTLMAMKVMDTDESKALATKFLIDAAHACFSAAFCDRLRSANSKAEK